MTWADDATTSYRATLRDEQAQREGYAERRRDLVARKVAQLRVPVVGPVSTGANLHGTTAGWALVELEPVEQGRIALGVPLLRMDQVDDTLHAWVREQGPNPWLYAGEVHTLADLGRVIVDGYQGDDPPGAAPAASDDSQATAGDLLLQVLTGLVRDVVAEALDDRLDSGT